MRALRCTLLLLALTAAPAIAQQTEPTPLERQVWADRRLLDVGWKLARASADLCPDARPAIGLMLRDVRGWAAPDAVREAFGQKRDFAVQAVASNSPAMRAGIAAGDEIVSLEGRDPNTLPAEDNRDWKRLYDVNETIEARLRSSGAVAIARSGEDERRIAGEPACYARFEVIQDSDRAASTGLRVRIGDRWLAGDIADDGLAFLVAHELAHNILKHRLRRELPRRKRPSSRDVEREADRLAPWLMARAGYDPAGAVAFLEKHGPGQDGFLYLGRSHDGWKSRRDAIAREIEAITAAGALDWTPYFEAELAAARDVMPPPVSR